MDTTTPASDDNVSNVNKCDFNLHKLNNLDVNASIRETPPEEKSFSSQRGTEIEFVDIKEEVEEDAAIKSKPNTPDAEEPGEECAKTTETSDKIVEYLVPLQTLEEGPGEMNLLCKIAFLYEYSTRFLTVRNQY